MSADTLAERIRVDCKHPFVWPNGDCVQCGVLATTMPGHTEPTHIMVPRYFAPLLSAAEKAEREQCCKDVCEDCRRGDVPNKVVHGERVHWMHKGKFAGFHECQARAIRNRE